MPQTQFNESNTVLNYVNTVVTLIGVIFGVWATIYHFNFKRATKHLGSICQDKDSMGWFVAHVPEWRAWIFPFYMRKVPIPRVPYIFTLLLAGEEGIFTSSLFDSIRDGARQVSWVPIYETFFVEAAWHSLERWSISHLGDGLVNPLEQHSDVTLFFRYLAKFYYWWLVSLPVELARFSLGLPPSAASNLPISREPNAYVQRRANRVLWKQLRIAKGKYVGWPVSQLHKYFGLFSIIFSRDIVVSVARSRISLVDRHLLYYPWNVWDDKDEASKKAEESIKAFSWLRQKRYKAAAPDHEDSNSNRSDPPRPILVKAQLELLHPDYIKKLTSPSPEGTADSKHTANSSGHEIKCATVDNGKMSPPEKYRQEQLWEWTFQRIWIHDNKPCIEVSEDELGALAIVMGIPLRCSEKDCLPSGPSAFSPCLTSTNDGCLTRLKVAYGRLRSSTPNVGSGYSILFAMYMSCNCLPFAHELVPPVALNAMKYNFEAFHAVHVTAEVLSLIKGGNTIWTSNRGARFSTASSKYLARLPSFAVPYLYDSGIMMEKEKKLDEEEQRKFIMEAEQRKFRKEEGKPGFIYKRDGDKYPQAGSWTNAVAGIALGGLVPMAAKPLIEAVKFTVGGGIDQDELDILEHLVELVQQQTREIFGGGDSGIQLFGPLRQYYTDLAFRNDRIDLGISLSNRDRILDIVLVLVRYNTLLERLIAMIPSREKPSLESVFLELCTKVSESYKTACEKEKERVEEEKQEKEKAVKDKLDNVKLSKEKDVGNRDLEGKPTGNETEAESRSSDLKELKKRIDTAPRTWQPTLKDCAIIAAYIIKAWTCIAKIVDWHEAGEKVDVDEEHMYKPVPFANLPDVSLWE